MKSETAQNSVGVVETRIARIQLPPEGFRMECGRTLPELQVAYETYGTLAPTGDNTVFICHALSGDAHVAGWRGEVGTGVVGWWDEMVGPGKGIDTDHYHVVCANILGGCKGTTGPSSINPATGKQYGSDFPPITVGDIVRAHSMLVDCLGIRKLSAVVGGSFGGMQALEWAIREPDRIDHCICIASAANLSAQALAFDIIGRRAIMSDPNWEGGDYYGTGQVPSEGLSLARKIGHITYLSHEMMGSKFGRERQPGTTGRGAQQPFRSDFQVESYLDHQGEKFVKRFDANSYLHITAAMDQYDMAEAAASLEAALVPLRSKVLVVALSSDWLFPAEQSVELANALLRAGKRVSYCCLSAPHGHDAFLVDVEHLSSVIRAFLPWVGNRSEAERNRSPDSAPAPELRTEYSVIAEWVRPGSRVLDLGCGNGELLSMLSRQKQASGTGVDISIQYVIDVIDRGHDIFQEDIDRGLAMIPDGAYECAILSETLQVVKKPRFVLREMLRVAREGIVSFPNFGKWSHRLQLWRTGRMPKGGALPFEWYDTPNIHLFTLRDFVDLCSVEGIRIMQTACIPSCAVGRWLIRVGWCNLGADSVIARITKGSPAEKWPKSCRIPD